MKDNNNKVKRICSFYVNDWHLTTTILPHINKMLEENFKVITIFENGIKNNVEELLERMNLNPNTQNKILEIKWTSSNIYKFSNTKNEIEEILNKWDKINIIVNGSKDYIELANTSIERIIKSVTKKEINIINCYDVTKYENVTQIVKNHDFVLNTTGLQKTNVNKRDTLLVQNE